jgi:hypothetical protein
MNRVTLKSLILTLLLGLGIVSKEFSSSAAQVSTKEDEQGSTAAVSSPVEAADNPMARPEVSQEMSILIDVFLQMRLAGKLIEKRDWQKTLVVQQQVIERLDELLRSVQPPASQPPQPQRPPSQQEKSLSPNPEQPLRQPEAAQSPPTETADQQSNDQAEPQTEELRRILRGLWGQLPERIRSQVSETIAEHFLPQYAPLIEQYYRRLAETLQPP